MSINGYWQTVWETSPPHEMLGVTCNGLAFHAGGVAILLVASCYRNSDKLGQCRLVGPHPAHMHKLFIFAFYHLSPRPNTVSHFHSSTLKYIFLFIMCQQKCKL